MLFRETSDWKKSLITEDERRLNELIRKTLEYRNAYRNANDPRLAQLWCAVLVLQKEITVLQARNRKIEDVFNAITNAVLRNENDKRELVRSLENY